jgi:hypothetical protein
MDDLLTCPEPRISIAGMERRREAVHQADANNRIEGQFSSPEANAVSAALIAGDIECSDLLPKIRDLVLPHN